MSGRPPASLDRFLGRLHVAILILLALGAAVWLWRTYGFSPLTLRQAVP